MFFSNVHQGIYYKKAEEEFQSTLDNYTIEDINQSHSLLTYINKSYH